MSKKPRIAVIIQARMGSARLPGKVLLPLAGAPMLQRLIERVSRSKLADDIVVATSVEAHDDAIASLCAQLGVRCFRGSEGDVLGRMIGAAGDADVMVRLTGDNPFVDGTLVDFVVDAYRRTASPVDYAANVEDCGFPYGLFVEVASMAALRDGLDSDDPMVREHVTWHLRQDNERYRYLPVTAPGPMIEEPVTCDTRADYDSIKSRFESLFAEAPQFTFRALCIQATAQLEAGQ